MFIVRLASRAQKSNKPNDVMRGYHSRCTETRLELVKGRVFVHPLPQLLDNVGYLVICLPSAFAEEDTEVSLSALGKIQVNPRENEPEAPIVAFVVDCGDADAVYRQVKLISGLHYGKRKIHVQSILSTHKHHDHTAGNARLRVLCRSTIKFVMGGAVERVPGCNYPVANGDKIPLPKSGGNDMNDVVEVEAIATPAHTRGSITYALRPLEGTESSASVCLFTGDTMFCGGGGVPFEADIDGNDKMTANAYIRAGAAQKAVERCFAEILYRSVKPDSVVSTDQLLVFPGHEYTQELLKRQLLQPNGTYADSCKWKSFSPSVFFETVSQLYVALHRRSLPHTSGMLLSVPSPVTRELHINPHLRSLKLRGTVVINAIGLWNQNFARETVSENESVFGPYNPGIVPSTNNKKSFQKSKATEQQWNVDAADVNRNIFATVYAEDLEAIIQDLASGAVEPNVAAARLEEMKQRPKEPVIGRRPIPGTLPSDRMIYRGLLGLALLGSSPTAMTVTDSETMKLPPPIVTSSDRIRISKKRLIAILYWLGLLDEDGPHGGKMVVAMIHQLWKETHGYSAKLAGFTKKSQDGLQQDSTDVESLPDSDDEVELGALKWVLYGIPEQLSSPLSSFCMPCFRPASEPSQNHPAGKSGMKQHAGELVRHDIYSCPLCNSAAGCPVLEEQMETNEDIARPPLRRVASTRTDSDDPDESDGLIHEVSPEVLGSLIKEAS
jgi:hydroxyacylglutathione hydrolase